MIALSDELMRRSMKRASGRLSPKWVQREAVSGRGARKYGYDSKSCLDLARPDTQREQLPLARNAEPADARF